MAAFAVDGLAGQRDGCVWSGQSVSQSAGYDGNRPPCGPHAGRATPPARRGGERDRKRIRAGGGGPRWGEEVRPRIVRSTVAGSPPWTQFELLWRKTGSARTETSPFARM